MVKCKIGFRYALMMVWVFICTIGILMVNAMVAFAQEAAEVAETVAQPGLLEKLLTDQTVLAIVFSVVAAIWGFLKKKAVTKDERTAKAFDFLEQGAVEAKDEYVDAIKEGRKDGKLTKDEIRNAQDLAKKKAIGYAKAEGFNLLKYISATYIPVLISKIVEAKKLQGKK